MRPPQTVHALNSFVALERRGVAQFVEGLKRDRRPLLLIQLRNEVAEHSYKLVRRAHDIMGPTMCAGLGTGRVPVGPGQTLGHVENPGVNPAYDGIEATLRGGLFAPLLAVACLPLLSVLAVSATAAAATLSVFGATAALGLHHSRRQGYALPWLEDAAGLITAVARASLTIWAAMLGAVWGLARFAARPVGQLGAHGPR